MVRPLNMLPRYSNRKFPPYRYRPGESPHPIRDPGGHCFGRHSGAPVTFTDWRTCEEYLYGIDLFNHGYWWEAHEALELVWVAAGKKSEAGQFIQGLILIAAAHLKRYQGLTEVSSRMAQKGLRKMSGVSSGIRFGIEIHSLRSDVLKCFSGKDSLAVTIYLEGIE